MFDNSGIWGNPTMSHRMSDLDFLMFTRCVRMGKTERVTRVSLLSLVLLLLLLSVHVSEASPGHLVHKFYKNQIQREEVCCNVVWSHHHTEWSAAKPDWQFSIIFRDTEMLGTWEMELGPPPCQILQSRCCWCWRPPLYWDTCRDTW